jgi:hypothetical protein
MRRSVRGCASAESVLLIHLRLLISRPIFYWMNGSVLPCEVFMGKEEWVQIRMKPFIIVIHISRAIDSRETRQMKNAIDPRRSSLRPSSAVVP